MDVPRISKAVDTYVAVVLAYSPRGEDGNLLTNWVDDGKTDIPKTTKPPKKKTKKDISKRKRSVTKNDG